MVQHSGCQGGRTLIEPSTLSAAGGQWRLITAPQEPRPAARRVPAWRKPTPLPPSRSRQREPWPVQGRPKATPQRLPTAPASLPWPSARGAALCIRMHLPVPVRTGGGCCGPADTASSCTHAAIRVLAWRIAMDGGSSPARLSPRRIILNTGKRGFRWHEGSTGRDALVGRHAGHRSDSAASRSSRPRGVTETRRSALSVNMGETLTPPEFNV